MYRYTYDQNLLLRPSAGLTNYRPGEQSSRRSLQGGMGEPSPARDGGWLALRRPLAALMVARRPVARRLQATSARLRLQKVRRAEEGPKQGAAPDKGARGTWSTVGGRRCGGSSLRLQS